MPIVACLTAPAARPPLPLLRPERGHAPELPACPAARLQGARPPLQLCLQRQGRLQRAGLRSQRKQRRVSRDGRVQGSPPRRQDPGGQVGVKKYIHSNTHTRTHSADSNAAREHLAMKYALCTLGRMMN